MQMVLSLFFGSLIDYGLDQSKRIFWEAAYYGADCTDWAQKLGKNELHAYQASQRGGAMRVRVEGERVYLGGQAVTVLAGKLLA